MDCTNKAINYPPKSNNSDKTALKNICHPAVYVQLTFALQSKQEHTFFGLCADICMQTDHFDAKNLKHEIVQKGSGVFDQLHSNPFDQVPAPRAVRDLNKVLMRGFQNPGKSGHQHILK